MLKRMSALFRQDLTLALRNAIFWVMAGTLVIMILVIRFFPSSEFSLPPAYYCDRTEGGVVERLLESGGAEGQTILTSAEAVLEAVLEDPAAAGIIVSGPVDALNFEVLYQGKMPVRSQNVMAASLDRLAAAAAGDISAAAFETRLLRSHVEPMPPNMTGLPALLAFEVIVLGFLLVAVFIFQEKSDGSIKAYRISPGGNFSYILSKTVLFALMGLIYGLFFLLFTIGIPEQLLEISVVLLLASALYTLLGIIVAVFFRSISDWLFIGVGLLILNMLPMISYGFPAFSPAFMSWIPSYPILFGLSELLFPTGRALPPLFIFLLAANLIAFGIAYFLVQVKLMKEGAR